MGAIVGIDLGTTNSALAYLNNAGNPEIVENAEGASVTPSVVFFEPGSMDRVVVGQVAKDNHVIYPARVAREFKRSMAQNAPIELEDGVTITPVELSGFVLKKLVKDATPRVGEITSAVITVPANFADEARRHTIAAGELAGLEVRHIVNEPTAALIYYSKERPVGGTVLVYDFGGGTLDVTIAKVDGTDVQILTSKGDPRLGGVDFDQALGDLIAARYEATSGEKFDPGVHQLSKTTEEYKKQLSVREEAAVQVTGGSAGRLILTLTRAEFESATRMLIARADMLVESTLEEGGLTPGDIRDVFLVGGSSRLPMVNQHLTSLFDKEPVRHLNPDEVVALGAALYSGLRTKPEDLTPAQRSGVGGVVLQEIANHYYGTIILDPTHAVGPRLRVSQVIAKNTPIPCEQKETFYTVSHNQQSVECKVTQSSTKESDPDFVRIIWEGELGPLPAGRPPEQEIEVTFSYDANQVMHCTFRDVATGISREVQLGMHDAEQSTPGVDIDDFLIE